MDTLSQGLFITTSDNKGTNTIGNSLPHRKENRKLPSIGSHFDFSVLVDNLEKSSKTSSSVLAEIVSTVCMKDSELLFVATIIATSQ